MPNLNSVFLGIMFAGFLVIVALGALIWIDNNKISSLTSQNTLCLAANKDFQTVADKQNDAIKKLISDQDKMQAAAKKAVIAAQKNAAIINQNIDQISKSKPSTDICKSANNLFNLYLGGKK